MSLFSMFDDAPVSGPLTILTVCTGNICRSPLAEVLLRKALHGLPIVAHSSGTHALVGSPMTEQNYIIASELGVTDGDQHVSRQLIREHLEGADLVLALTRDHRRAVVEMLPRVSRQVFTLREFGRLADAVDLDDLQAQPAHTPEQRMRDAVELAAELRGSLPPLADPNDDDVIDPYRRSDEIYAQSAHELVPAVNATASLLRRAAQVGGAHA